MTFLAKTSEIPDGARALVMVNEVPVAVFHQDGRFYALHNDCPHRQGPLSRGTVAADPEGHGCFVRCPMHGWKFHLDTGDSYGRPENATVYAVTQKDDSLYIEL